MAYTDKIQEKLNKIVYYRKNREILLARAKEWNKAHPEAMVKHRKDYQSRLQRVNFQKAIKLNPNMITKGGE